MPDVRVERIEYPPAPHQVFFFAHWVASELTYRKPALLFITEWGIWPSSENWHLYYIRVLVAEEVNIFVVAEKCVYIVSFCQNVASPTVQHGQLQEGCEVFRFVFQK
jgi:hypothetical protein